MFVCIATKPLNDGTKGFRFNLLGMKGLCRYRRKLHLCKNTFGIVTKECTNAVYLGKLALYFEKSRNKKGNRRIRHFAG